MVVHPGTRHVLHTVPVDVTVGQLAPPPPPQSPRPPPVVRVMVSRTVSRTVAVVVLTLRTVVVVVAVVVRVSVRVWVSVAWRSQVEVQVAPRQTVVGVSVTWAAVPLSGGSRMGQLGGFQGLVGVNGGLLTRRGVRG